MTTILKERALQSGLVLSDETPEWNENNWPPLEGGWRWHHATVVLDHPDEDNNIIRGQTVVVLGGYHQRQGGTNSVLVLNLAVTNMRWREGPSMDKSRREHAAVVCNGAVYVIGGHNQGPWDCIERIDVKDLLRSSSTSSTTQDSSWMTLTCRLSTRRFGCRAVAVHNRYIVVIGGYYNLRFLSSVDFLDTRNHIVTAGPSMTVKRQYCASAVIGHRIFVVGGWNERGNLDSVEYLDLARPCGTEKTKEDSANTFISFSPTWTTHSELLSISRSSCAMVAVGSCLVVAGGRGNSSVDVLDTHRNRVWNLRPFSTFRRGCGMVTVANQVAVIGGNGNLTCATLPLMDKNTWCFLELSERMVSLFRQIGKRDVNVSSRTNSTSTLKDLVPIHMMEDRT